MNHLEAISPLDGRYAYLVEELRQIFSEYGLIRHRVEVEVQWLEFILTDLDLAADPDLDLTSLQGMVKYFCLEDAQRVKDIEKKTNHDVKAVEYYIKEKLDEAGLSGIREWVHFACTSEDINNTAYALMLDKARNLAVGLLRQLIEKLEQQALVTRSMPMMSRTHGQPATPTTTGKELVNFAWRINEETRALAQETIQAKINGATGNYNAHCFVFPEIDWISASRRFLTNCLGLTPMLFTTQINSNGSLSHILHCLIRSAAVIIDLDRDMWGYISLGYFRQRVNKGETGSSTMPHKVNPIDFENSEGNLGLAVSLMEHLAVKLQKSRFQRDLSDSTVLRSLGSAFAYFFIGVKNCLKGLDKIDLDKDALARDLEANPALLAEPFQTAMRVFGEENPYERLKELTRGQNIGPDELHFFVSRLEKVPPEFKDRMSRLTPGTYIGLAKELVDLYFSEKKEWEPM